ncbi:MAG: hypothetical protein AAGI44_18260 [Pseudomonadota bacterium]
MSISAVTSIKERVKHASELSPIAVFVVEKQEREGARTQYALDAVFADTIAAQQRIIDEAESYVGSFHARSFSGDMFRVEHLMKNALRRAERGDA